MEDIPDDRATEISGGWTVDCLGLEGESLGTVASSANAMGDQVATFDATEDVVTIDFFEGLNMAQEFRIEFDLTGNGVADHTRTGLVNPNGAFTVPGEVLDEAGGGFGVTITQITKPM